MRKLLPNWDHLIPYSYSYSNADENFVAACSVCNAFKSSHIFISDEECKEFIQKKWDKHLSLKRIVFLDEEMTETENNCKKNTLNIV